MMILRRILFIGGAAMLIALAAQNANGSTWALPMDAQFLLLVGGVIGVGWGLGDRDKRQDSGVEAQHVMPLQSTDAQRTRGLSPLLKSTTFPVILITLLALGLRLWQLETSVHYFVDELNFVDGVLNVIEARSTGEVLHLVHPFHWLAAFPRLYPYLQNWGTVAGGQTLTGLRLASVIFGTLTIPAVYLLGKEMFERRIGLVAALLLATFPPHIHFSRLGLNNIADPLFGTLALAFLARALRDRRQGDFAWAGAMLGLTQYFYEGGRVVYPVVIGAWLAFSFITNRQDAKKNIKGRDVQLNAPTRAYPSWRSIGVFALTTVLVMLPFYTVTMSYDLGFTPRLASKGLGDDYWRMLLLSTPDMGMLALHTWYVLKTFAIYAFFPDQSFYYGGNLPLILPYLAPAFLVGVFNVLLRGKRVLLLILLLASLGNSLLRYSPWASGYVVTFPMLCVLVAFGLQKIGQWIQKRGIFTRVQRAAPLLVTILALGQIVYYFGPHMNAFRELRPIPDTHDAVFRSLEFPPNTYVHLVGDIVFFNFDILRMQEYLERSDLRIDIVRQVEDATYFTAEYLQSLPRDADHAFFLPINNEANITLLRQYFDVQGPIYTPYDVPTADQLVLYYASAP
jgi:hypothetical protein